MSGSHVEHYRPKGGAWLNAKHTPKRYTANRYWWLTWTWENLLLSCATCNNPTYKGNAFPLVRGGKPLALPPKVVSTPPPNTVWNTGGEKTLLVDPGRQDPLKHIVWVPVDRTLPEKKWVWTPKGRPRGDVERSRSWVSRTGLTT